MPILNAKLKPTTLAAHKHLSYESLVSSWLSGAGWEVLIPMVDHGRKTDLVVADDHDYYRIQVKSLQAKTPDIRVENKWGSAKLHYVVYFSTLADWGFITPAFPEASRRLDCPDHCRFHPHSTNFLKAFERIR